MNIENVIYGLFQSIFIYTACLSFVIPLKHKKSIISRSVFLGLLVIVLEVFMNMPHIQYNMYLCDGIILIYMLLFTIVTCEQSIKGNMYCTIWTFMIYQIINPVTRVLINENAKLLCEVIVLLGIIVAYFFIYYLVIRNLSKDREYDIGPRQMTLSFLMLVIFEILYFNRTPANSNSLYKLVILMGEIYCVTVLYLENVLFKKSEMKNEIETMNVLLQQQKAQYLLSKQSIDTINQKCHDLKHQINALHSMQGTEQYNHYLNELRENINIYDSVIRTENEALNIVLTEKCLYCESKQIKINCVVDGKRMNFIDAIDIYSIMGNALDNAIESVEKMEDKNKRIIDVIISVKQEYLSITISNPIGDKLVLSNGMPVSTKVNDGYHGYGLKSIKHTVKKYHGLFSYTTENDCFSLYILIPLQDKD